jgi:hypothetical protein
MGVAPDTVAETPERLTSAAVAAMAVDVIEAPQGAGTTARLDDGTSAASDALHDSHALPMLAGAAPAGGDQQRRGDETEDESDTKTKHTHRHAFHVEPPCNLRALQSSSAH